MHVAFLNQDKGIGPKKAKGARAHIESMINAFARLGARVTQIDEPDHAAAYQKLIAAQENDALDLIYQRYSLHGKAGAVFAEESRTPLVVEVNSPLIEEAARHRDSPDRLAIDDERIVFEAADGIFAVSNQVADYVAANGGATERISVTANAVDCEMFVRRDTRAKELAAIPEDRVILGFHGRLRPWHGFDRFVQALESLHTKAIPIHLLTIGVGDFAAQLQGRFPSSCHTHFDWLPQEQAARLVAGFDILPLTYSADAPFYFSPLKLLEAMACGAVPVVPDLGDLRDVVRHQENGLVYDASAPGALEQAVELLVSSSSYREGLSHAAEEFAQKRSWIEIAKLALDIAHRNATAQGGAGSADERSP